MAARTFARLASAGQGRRLFLLSWVAYAAAYVGRYNYSAVMSAITAEGTLTLSAAGAVSTGYFVCYAAGQILCGILSQKASPFGMIPLGLALSAGCNFGMGVAPAGAMPLLWAANGLFQAMVWPPIVRLFAECMPFEQQDSACVSINDAGDLLAAGALLFRDPLLAAAAQGPLCEETLWDFGPDAPARLAALPAAWPDCPSQKLEASGNYILRSGWGREDTWIHFRAGSLGGGHGHADLLHVDVYHGGEAVLTDAGRGTYVDGGLRRALKGPAAHNTFRVDGAGFTCYRGTWEWGPIAQPLPALARFTPLADRLAGGHLGYLAQGAAVERQLVFLKPGLLVGADILRAPDGRPHRAEQFFHFGPGRLTAGESAALWEGGRTCAQLHWLSGQRAECFAAPCAPAYNRVEDAPALRLDAPAAAGVTALVWVLSLGGPCQAELVPVSTGAGQPLPPGTAGAVRIRRDGAESTVLFSWQAGSHDAGLLCAGDCTGHGNVLVFTPQCPQGLCLD